MKWKCTKCGEVVTSPPLNNDCPRGGQHSWIDTKYKGIVNKHKVKKLILEKV